MEEPSEVIVNGAPERVCGQPAASANAQTAVVCPDGVLVEKARAGDTRAFGELVARYWAAAFAAAFAQLGNPESAEDVAQQTFVTGWRKLHQLRRAERFAAWIIKIATRHAGRLRRRARLEPVLLPRQSDSDHPVARQPDPTQPLLEAEGRREVWDAVHDLAPSDQTLVVLRYCEGLSFRAISGKTGRSEGALRVRLHRIHVRLKHALSEYFEET